MQKLLLLITPVIALSCSSASDFSFDCENKSRIDLQIQNIDLQRVDLPEFKTSMIGETIIGGDKLYYADKKLRSVYEITPSIDSCRRVLRAGHSNREYEGGIDAFYYSKDRDFRILCDCWITVFDLDSISMIQKSDFVIYSNPVPEEDFEAHAGTYSLLYDQLRAKEYNDTLYLSIAGNHPLWNMYIPGYFKNTRIIKGIPLLQKDGHFTLGRLSPTTKKQSGKRQFFMFDFDMDEAGNFYVSYDLDSLIYKFDHQFNIVESWGNAGRDMDFSEHKALPSLTNFKKSYEEERKKSHYRKICRVGEYTFRTYAKRLSATTDGLQIYRKNALIADVDIPRNIDIIGKIGDYYYSNVIGDESSADAKMWFYKFKL